MNIISFFESQKEKNKKIGKIPKIEENKVINKVGVYQWQKK